MPRTRPLDFYELRVLGALLEKEQTTPDHYPLTINAAISACNQKTNRDPVTQLTETEVVEALDRLRLDVLTWRSEGARAERWEHRLDRRWHLDEARKAVMTLLVLRGPQTPGELKTRSERMHRFESVAEVEATLRDLAAGDEDSLVMELPRRAGQRENRWAHLVGTEDAAAEHAAAAAQEEEAAVARAPSAPRGPSAVERLEVVEASVAALEEQISSLVQEPHALRVRLGDLEE
ncbi:MAG: YceH family protein [Acidobacteriota bacterium]